MESELEKSPTNSHFIPKRFRFHPLIRFSMLLLSSITIAYSLYFIFIFIPRYSPVPVYFKMISVIILFIAGNTLVKHLTSLNSVIVREDQIELRFLIRKTIVIPWRQLICMEIFKVITHYWKISFYDNQGFRKTFKTSLAFPGIWELLVFIQDRKPEMELNELLRQVLLYKRSIR